LKISENVRHAEATSPVKP